MRAGSNCMKSAVTPRQIMFFTRGFPMSFAICVMGTGYTRTSASFGTSAWKLAES